MADNTKPKTIDYQEVNFISNNQTLSKITSALKKAKLENIQRNFKR
jgi:hypothetical protein